MENRRFILICVLGVILYFMYQAWQQDYAAQPRVVSSDPYSVPELPSAAASSDTDELPTPSMAAAPSQSATDAPEATDSTSGRRIRVRTDVLDVEISTTGGDLRRVAFPTYPLNKDQPDQPVALMDDRNGRWFVLQGGITSNKGVIASQRSEYRAEAFDYQIGSSDRIVVPLVHMAADGTVVEKRYIFERGRYLITVEQRVVNGADVERSVNPFLQLWRTDFDLGGEPPFIQSFKGVGIYEQKAGGDKYRFRKFSHDDLEDETVELNQTGGWLTMMQHYFMAAVLPAADEQVTWVAKTSKTRGYLGQYLGAPAALAPGGEHSFSQQIYIGPKLQNRLTEIAPGFELTVDYGILTPIAEPLFWFLDLFHDWTGNWGFSIILLTLLVKLVLYKLSEAQYRSMAKMRKFAPRIQDLKERYGDDRERMQKAMMDLYKKEGFNPLAGCWPLLVQFPVFIALYWVLLESVELRQADFMLWWNDLSAPDPYFVLPVLFGISMFLQQRLSGTAATMDPMQQRIMNVMPIMLTAFFAFFPVGLVLYWFISNVVGIAQQWVITRKLDREGIPKK